MERARKRELRGEGEMEKDTEGVRYKRREVVRKMEEEEG